MRRNVSFLKLLLVGIMICAIFSVACQAGKDRKKAPPKFHIRKTAVDVGDVFEGQDITHTYKVRNNGVGELHIINVKPG